MDQRSGEAFFFHFALTVFLIVVLSFGIHAIMRAGHLPPMSAPLFIHAILMFGWYGLFAAQAGLVRSGNVSLHMRLGKLSIILAAGVFVSGFLVMAENYQRKAEPLVASSNVMAMIAFAGLYLAALAKRKRPLVHKRLMVFASVVMLAPALTRFARAFDLGEGIILPLWVLTAASVIVYDLKRLRKVHAATVAGCVTFVLAVVAMIALGISGPWKAFLDSILK
ncbi:MAG: hypothetical protein J5I65_04650 [Aridibacter famidurans]|nr:hypothetical protein [Aridibacter famidurans]